MRLPVELALAQACPEVPTDTATAYEPKFDGWRCCGGPGALYSRAGRQLTARFPEIAEALRDLGDVVLDGELVAWHDRSLDFAALQASPARRRTNGVQVYLMAFDLLARGHEDTRSWPYEQRRAALSELLDRRGFVQAVPMTTFRAAALEWMEPGYAPVGIEGVVAKPLTGSYRAGRRSGWRKTRALTTTEAAVLGVTRTCVVLGRRTRSGHWRAVGLSRPANPVLANELARTLRCSGQPARLPGVLAGMPGSDDIDYQPTAIDTVVELEADSAVEFGRWRHPPRILRLRGDLTPNDLPHHTEHTRKERP